MTRACHRAPSPGRREGGFTYIAILLAVALHGAVLAAVGIVWSNAQKRERETQLLFVGHEFRKAIRSYAAGAGGAGGLPESLEDLLRDPRTPALKRHLRKIYVDPMTGKAEWGLVRSAEGKGILGVYSLSQETPFKIGNFAEEDKDFENKASYQEWKFAIRPVQQPKPVQPGAPGAPGAPATAPGTLPQALQPGQPPAFSPGTAAPPGSAAQPGAPTPILQPPAEPQPIPVLQPTQPQPPPQAQQPPAAEPAAQPAPEAAPPAEQPAPETPAAETAPAPAPPPTPAPAPESPFTPGLLSPIAPMAPPPAPTTPAPAPVVPPPATPTPAQ